MSAYHTQLNARQWAAVRRSVLDRDGWRCRACGKAGRMEVDHVTPLHKGGDPYDPANLQCLCRGCHIAKTARENRRPGTPAERRWWRLMQDMTDEMYEDNLRRARANRVTLT